MIEKECTSEHPILNMQDGKGYFQPAADEMHLVKLYLAQENHRTVRIRKNCLRLRNMPGARMKWRKPDKYI